MEQIRMLEREIDELKARVRAVDKSLNCEDYDNRCGDLNEKIETRRKVIAAIIKSFENMNHYAAQQEIPRK